MTAPMNKPDHEQPDKLTFRWKGPAFSHDHWDDEIRTYSLQSSNEASATLKREGTRRPIFYVADIRNPDGTRLASVYIHTNLADARKEVQERIEEAARQEAPMPA